MLNIIIFSKDRACQLDLFLRGLSKFYKGSHEDSVQVIYTYSSDEFKRGYDALIARDFSAKLTYENGADFKTLTESLINTKNPYTVFFVDDNIFKAPFSIDCKEMLLLERDSDIACLSLRMHKGINYCYTIPCDTPPPELSSDNTWDWLGLKGDWGYPMSLDGHIFRTTDILGLMKALPYRSPNTLEGALANFPLSREKMVCLNDSAIFNNPCNKVQNDNGNHCGNVSAEYLNSVYLEGKIISMDNTDGVTVTSPHTEVKIIFEG